MRDLRDSGVTIILTTHYIEEAEEMADRIGVINKGELVLVEDKAHADAQAGPQASCACTCSEPLQQIPAELAATRLTLADDGHDAGVQLQRRSRTGRASPRCCARWRSWASNFRDLETQQSSLEDIFVSLVTERA